MHRCGRLWVPSPAPQNKLKKPSIQEKAGKEEKGNKQPAAPKTSLGSSNQLFLNRTKCKPSEHLCTSCQLTVLCPVVLNFVLLVFPFRVCPLLAAGWSRLQLWSWRHPPLLAVLKYFNVLPCSACSLRMVHLGELSHHHSGGVPLYNWWFSLHVVNIV